MHEGGRAAAGGGPEPRSVVVLAGGRSRRMGRDKALLPWAGVPLLGLLLERARAAAPDVVLAARDTVEYRVLAEEHGARLVSDVVRDAGPLAGLHAGLGVARHDAVLAVACDMPFLDAAALVALADRLPGFDAVVPRDERWHPLHAAYRRSTCLPAMEEQLRRRSLSLHALLERLNVCAVPVDAALAASLRNVNTPEEYRSLSPRDRGAA